MSGTLTIRLAGDDRATLEEAAAAEGKGLSAYLREIAEGEAQRLRRARIRAEGQRVVQHLTRSATARDELDLLGTPQST